MKHIHKLKKFSHDCTSCKYLGTYIASQESTRVDYDIWIDAYICKAFSKCGNGTLISRFGGEGEYSSMDIDLIKRVLYDEDFKESLCVQTYKMYMTEIEGV